MVSTAPNPTDYLSDPTPEMVEAAYGLFLEHTEARDAAENRAGKCATCRQQWTCPGRTWAMAVLRNAARRDLALA